MKETEPFRAALATLKSAEKRAAATAWRCERCGHVATMSVRQAEDDLLRLIRSGKFEHLLDITEGP